MSSDTLLSRLMNRHNFLKMLIKGVGLLAAGVVAIPALITAVCPGFQRRASAWVPVGRVGDFPVGDTRSITVRVPREDWARSLREKSVYVWRPAVDEIVVFSRSCTDLSCPVTWDPGSGWFFCPCHGGIFAQNGERVAGPPKRALHRFANRIRSGMIEINLHSIPAVG